MSEADAVGQRYILKNCSAPEVSAEVESILGELERATSLPNQLTDRGYSLGDLHQTFSNAGPSNAIKVENTESHFGAETTAILIAFAPVAVTIAQDVWHHFVLPQLIKRFGAGSIRADEESRAD